MRKQKRMKLKLVIGWILVCLFLGSNSGIYANSTLRVKIEKNEFWWIGVINQGQLQPMQNGFNCDLTANLYGNQAQPLLLSDKGGIIWSEEPFTIKCENDSLILSKPSGTFYYSRDASNLKEAYKQASKQFFPPSGKMPDEFMFARPQYNTWIELLYNQKEDLILSYARSIISSGLPAGVIMIDDNWQEDYGVWDFNPRRFHDPRGLIDTLHRMGFKVMLWVCPFISPDSETSRFLESRNALLKADSDETKIVKWWNGYSTVLDFSKPFAGEWFIASLHKLQSDYGIDGFKFDGGDPEYYVTKNSSFQSPNDQTELFAKIGVSFPYNEYRACWKMGGQPLAQRLRDKGHTWEDLHTLIPDILLQGIMGYPFACPDMIGGGEMGSFQSLDKIDQDLIVRSAQCHAFMPMMQFSVAPWRVLDETHFNAVKKAIDTRMKNLEEIMLAVKNAALSGEPAVRYMAYEFPDQGYSQINDQFLVGSNLMIAPFLVKSAVSRKVVIPKGKWIDDQGKVFKGPAVIDVKAELERIPYYKKITNK